MTIIPAFAGLDGEDPVEYIKSFKRGCICSGFVTPASWAELLPTFLDKTASTWYTRQSVTTKKNWELLEKELLNTYQITESYQSLVASLGTLRQGDEESARAYTERVRELGEKIKKSLAAEMNGALTSTDEISEVEMKGIDSMVLRGYITGCTPHIQQHLNYLRPTTLEGAAELAYRQEASVRNVVRPLGMALTPPCTMQAQPVPVLTLVQPAPMQTTSSTVDTMLRQQENTSKQSSLTTPAALGRVTQSIPAVGAQPQLPQATYVKAQNGDEANTTPMISDMTALANQMQALAMCWLQSQKQDERGCGRNNHDGGRQYRGEEYHNGPRRSEQDGRYESRGDGPRWRNNNSYHNNGDRSYGGARSDERTPERRYGGDGPRGGATSNHEQRGGRPFTPQRSVGFNVTCYECGELGHVRYDCPKRRAPPADESKGKQAEVNMLEQVLDSPSEIEDIMESMAASGEKRGRPSGDRVDPKIRSGRKRSKSVGPNNEAVKGSVVKPRRKIGIDDMLISKGQREYSITEDLSMQQAHITIGQLVARCPSLRRELRSAVSTRKKSKTGYTYVATKCGDDLQAPRVVAEINGVKIPGCLVDGGSSVNVMSNWCLEEIDLKVNRPSAYRLRVVDQRSVRPLGQLDDVAVAVNGVTVKIEFQVLDISSTKGGYPIILGRPWLKLVRAINYWNRGKMTIGPRSNRVELSVNSDSPSESGSESETSSSESWTGGSSSSSDYDSECEAEVFSMEAFPQALKSEHREFGPNKPLARDPQHEEEVLSKVQLGPELREEERDELQALIREFSDIFVTKHTDLPAINLEEHKVELVEGAVPVRNRQRRLAPSQVEVLRRELDQLLEAGFIIPVTNSTWVSPVEIVPKKNGKWRVCVNYKSLNKVTKKDRFPLPFIDELLDEVSGHEFYSFCDGYSGYHQIKVREADIPKTTFTTPWGTYAYTRMPFGMSNSSGTFQRVQMEIFRPYLGKFVRVFLDDFSVYGRRCDHIMQLRLTFERLAMFQGSLSPEKCKFGFREGVLLGHLVSVDGIRVDRGKVAAIAALRNPANYEEMRKLWGKVSYHNRFMDNLAETGRPISRLISPKVNFEWSEKCELAFDCILDELSKNPVMRTPDWSRKFILNPDTSANAIACVLIQNDDSGRGHPVYYASRLMTTCELKYTDLEKLAMAVLFGCIKYKHYIVPSPFPVEVQSPRDGLKNLLGQANPVGRVARLMAGLQQFDLHFKVERGQRAQQASLLLEFGAPENTKEGELSCGEEVFVLEHEPELMAEFGDIVSFIRRETYPENSTTSSRRKLRTACRPYLIVGEMLYHQGKDGVRRRVLCKSEVNRVLKECHDGMCGGHFAQNSTAKKILSTGYYWPALFKDVQAYCSSCETCQLYGKRTLSHGELHPITPTGPFDKWGVDFVGPLPKSARKNQYLIVATDYMTKWAEALPVKQATQDVAADFIFSHVACRFGCPLELVTDRGSHFVGGVVTALLSKLSVKHRKASPYYPQANGLVEKTNGILCGIIGKMVLDKRREWDKNVNSALWAYRTTHKVATNYTPFYLTYGQEAILPIELEIPTLRTALRYGVGEANAITTRLVMLESLDESRRQALYNLDVVQNRRKAYHDRMHAKTIFDPGDLVLRLDCWLMKQKGQKFFPRWKGPFVIREAFKNDSYKLGTLDGELIDKHVNIEKLKLFRPRP